MSSNIESGQFLFRDGTSQQDRPGSFLDPANILFEERSMETLIAEAQRLAKEIRFFNEQNKAMGNWEPFLVDDAALYLSETPAQQDIIKQQWAQQLATYVDAPERFQSDATKLAQLSRPHVVLFMTFLQLLNHIKSQLNGLTKKHLDCYFLERLQLTPRAAVPDMVNVLVHLAGNIDQLEIKEGTVLLAGKDEEGNELHYTTDYDTVISQATITQLKTVFVDKRTLTMADARLNNINDADKGFTKMMEMALGDPNPADPLPPLPDGVTDLVALSEALGTNATCQRYIEEQLYLSIEDFNLVIQVHLNDLDSKTVVTENVWQEVYAILDRAYKDKISWQRQQVLKNIREQNASTGFDDLVRYVYGTPDAGDALPVYKGAAASLTTVYNDLCSESPSAIQEASGYIDSELFLTGKNFIQLMQVSENSQATADDWDAIYEMLEQAERKVRSAPLPSPYKEELIDVYANANATASAFSATGDQEESLRFKTFGGYSPDMNRPLTPATIGVAISSPVLQLQEGKRQITCVMALQAPTNALNKLTTLFAAGAPNGFPPLQVYLTIADAWVQQTGAVITFGDFLTAKAIASYEATINQYTVTKTTGNDFNSDAIGSYLVWTDGVIYRITDVVGPSQVRVQQAGVTDSRETIQQYDAGAVYLNALQVLVELQETDGAVAPVSTVMEGMLPPGQPVLALVLNHVAEGQQYRSHYQALLPVTIEKIYLQADVQGMKNSILQQDEGIIDARKPFDLFGAEPESGASFYLTSKELAQKRLDSLQLYFQWMKTPPPDFAEYYANYWRVQADDEHLSPADYTIKGNDDFRARVFFNDKGVEWELPEIELFTTSTGIDNIPNLLRSSIPSCTYQYKRQTPAEAEEVLDWERFFRLELSGEDFQHSLYYPLLTRQAVSDNAAIKKLLLNPPYTPRLKKLLVSYSAHTELYPGQTERTTVQLYHLHPFGFAPVQEGTSLLPVYNDEGSLYLGINQLIQPQTLSLLFQMAEGSANPDVEKPAVSWSYLQSDQWVLLGSAAIIADTSNELLNTGIVRLNIPVEAANNNTVMPGGVHWIKVSCTGNSAAIPDTIAIRAQGLSATFSSTTVAASHFNTLLPAGSVTETLEPNSSIRQLEQPYTSVKGKPAEKDTTFYTRISERLRHKNRALTMWDYERIILDRFPEVYKVKCLPATDTADAGRGKVHLMVIPDSRGQLPFNPFQPKVPANILGYIQTHLESVAPAFADITVTNPSYLQVMVRCVVKFREGYSEGYYKPKLVEAVKRFLSPWAYGGGNDITIGGTIYASVIINFIAEQPYIAFVANMKLFQSDDGIQYTDARTLNGGKNQVTASEPDRVLVSAPTHVFDIVDENGYDKDNYEGINYMQVELDFQVGQNA